MHLSRLSGRPSLGGTVLVCALVVASCSMNSGSAGATKAAPPPDVRIEFDSQTGAPSNTGSALVDIDVSTANGGRLTSGKDIDGEDSARFPAYDATSPSPRAAVTVADDKKSDGDVLSPGAEGFTLSAAFTLDAQSEGSKLDNGNNIMQRGLYVDPAQYKLQLDHGHVSCRVRGSEGEAFVKSALVVQPGTAYTAACTRAGDRLTLVVDPAGAAAEKRSATGEIGTVTMPRSTVLSLGGKVDSSGDVLTGAADQFNGTLADVELDVD